MNTQTWKQGALTVPAAGVALLPKAFCPMCWPAYAAGLSALGIGFVPLTTAYLLPLTAVVLLLSVGVLRRGAKRRGATWPVWMAFGSALLILIGKFAAESTALLYVGVIGFSAAAVWNAWKTVHDTRPSCCTTRETNTVTLLRSHHGTEDAPENNRNL